MTPAVFKRSIRDLQVWSSNCMVAFSGSDPIGVLIARFTNDAHMLRHSVVKALTGMVKDSLKLMFLVVVMFVQEWMLAVIAFVVFPAAIWPIVRARIRLVGGSATPMELSNMDSISTPMSESSPRSVSG